ncbi:MAG: hypothetical protein ACYS83_02250 [Planctomycetota bacterium]
MPICVGAKREGVQIRLRAERLTWRKGETPPPRFRVDMRNRGTRELRLVLALKRFEVQLDGVCYERADGVQWGFVREVPFGPGQELTDFPFWLEENIWRRGDRGLDLTPGRHRIRVAFSPSPTARDSGFPFRAVSNPVEIDILPEEKLDMEVERGGWNTETDLSPSVIGQRNALLTEADAKIRAGLIELGKRFPRLEQGIGWNRIIRPLENAAGWLEIRLHHNVAKQAPDRTAQFERFRLTIDIRPPAPPTANVPFQPLYPYLGLVGRIDITAGDPELDAALNKLIDDALAPLETLDRQAGQSREYRAGELWGEPVEIEILPGRMKFIGRAESVEKLKRLGKALITYANDDEEGKYPDTLRVLAEQDYIKEEDSEWFLENVQYLGKGKTAAEPPDTPIAFDKALLERSIGSFTSVLFNDGHVVLRDSQHLHDLGIPPFVFPEGAVSKINQFREALARSAWEEALSYCSDSVKAAAKEYESAEAFFRAVVPVEVVIGKPDILRHPMKGDYTRLLGGLHFFPRSGTGDTEEELWWQFRVDKGDTGWIIDFGAKSIRDRLERRKKDRLRTAEYEKERQARRKAFEWKLKAVKARTRLTPLTKEFVLGERMLFRLELLNEGEVEFLYDHQQVAVNSSMTITDEKGERVPYTFGPEQTTGGYKPIKPGKSAVLFDNLDIARQYDVSKAGKYKVQFNSKGLYTAIGTGKGPFDNTIGIQRTFPSNIVEIEVRALEKHVKEKGAAGRARMVAVVRRQLDEIVDLSGLNPEMSFSDALEELKNSVKPRLNIIVLWRDLEENAEIDRTTPINMDPISVIRLGTALELLLKSISRGVVELGYVVEDGVIIIATKESLPSDMETRVYDIYGFLGPQDEKVHDKVKDLCRLIIDTVEPDSWSGARGKGAIEAVYENRKLIVMQTPQVHQKIAALLDKMRKAAIGNAVAIESRFMTVSDNFLEDLLPDSDANGVGNIGRKVTYGGEVVLPGSESAVTEFRRHLANAIARSAVSRTSEGYNIALDNVKADFLLRAMQAHRDSKVLTAPKVMVLEGERAYFRIHSEDHYISCYTEPNSPSEKPEPKHDSIEIGMRVQLLVKLPDGGNNILLDVDFEISQLIGFEERLYKEKYPYQIPKTEVVSSSTRLLVPDGGTVLIGGDKIKVKKEDGERVEGNLLVLIKAESVNGQADEAHALAELER